MKSSLIKIFAVIVLNNLAVPLFGQRFEPKERFAIELSLENTDLKRLPIYRNSIASLTVIGDYIIGGTTANEGLSPYVFVASISERKLINFRDVGEVVSGQRSVQSGLCKGQGNTIFAGTIANKSKANSLEGGHIIQIEINGAGEIDMKDLGVPIPGEGIFSLASNEKGNMLYGITYPSGKFFTYDTSTRQTRSYEDITPSQKEVDSLTEYVLQPDDYLCRALILDNQGMVYGSLPINKLFCFNPQDESFQILDTTMPVVWGRKMLGRVDSWAKSPDGKLYGGNAGDGQLFQLDPATKEIKNLGKPITMNRLKGLAFGNNGKLYGIAGALPGYAHLFTYDDVNGFFDLGIPNFPMVAPGIEQGIPWRSFQLETMAASADGNYIVMGEGEALSQLMVFKVD